MNPVIIKAALTILGVVCGALAQTAAKGTPFADILMLIAGAFPAAMLWRRPGDVALESPKSGQP